MAWILVVDDDVATRDTLRFVLEDSGYQVLEAADGHAALPILAEAAPSLAAPSLVALIDLLMPGMDGVDLLRSILANPRLATRHRYIGMTAAVGPVTSQAEALLAQLHGAFLEKPFGIDTLLEAVARACDSLIGSDSQTTFWGIANPPTPTGQ
jgi:CheY-like chemotaxis protein